MFGGQGGVIDFCFPMAGEVYPKTQCAGLTRNKVMVEASVLVRYKGPVTEFNAVFLSEQVINCGTELLNLMLCEDDHFFCNALSVWNVLPSDLDMAAGQLRIFPQVFPGQE